jgi:hypothetical protein
MRRARVPVEEMVRLYEVEGLSLTEVGRRAGDNAARGVLSIGEGRGPVAAGWGTAAAAAV